MTDDNQQPDPPSIDQVLADYLRRLDAGDILEREAFLKQHPELAEDLAELLETADLIDQMAGPMASDLWGEDLLESTVEGEPKDDQHEETGDWNHSTHPHTQSLFSMDEEPLTGEALQASGNIRDTANLKACQFGNYELLEVIGRGGMGVVYRAREVSMDRTVAVKMINSGRLASEVDIQRFLTEARAAGQLEHPNIVTVYQMGQQDGYHFYSMDYIEGCDLSEAIRSGPLPPDQAARYLKICAEAIQFAHDNGILHRDLKPANVVIDERNRPVITDFGLAKYVAGEKNLTSTGAALGTPSYMSPEQASAKQHLIGPASDVYSLGSVLYALLTGKSPFRGETVVETITDVLHKSPPPPRSIDGNIPLDLETICLKCLEKDPRKRYETAQDLADDLERFLNNEPVAARPRTQLRKVYNWLLHVPLIAAIMGRTTSRPSVAQRRTNLAIMLLPFVVAILVVAVQMLPERLPNPMRAASATPGGVYHEFCIAYADVLRSTTDSHVAVLATDGSVENRELLLDDGADFALVQEDVVSSDQLACVAPLYYDVVHIVARKSSGMRSIRDLAGRRVALGAPQSGMQLTARALLSHCDIDVEELADTEHHFLDLTTHADLDAAIVTTGRRNSDLNRLLASGEFVLIGLDSADADEVSLQVPWFRHVTIHPHTYADQTVPTEPLTSVATSTFMVVRKEASNLLVRTLLETLYESGELRETYHVFPRSVAATWRGYAFHPEANRFFAETPRKSAATR